MSVQGLHLLVAPPQLQLQRGCLPLIMVLFYFELEMVAILDEKGVSYLQMGYDAIIQLVLLLVLHNHCNPAHLLVEELVLLSLRTDYGALRLVQRSFEGSTRSMAVVLSVVEEELA